MFPFRAHHLIELRVFAQDAPDQPPPFHRVETVRDLVSVRFEHRPAPPQREADLRAGKPPVPSEDQAPHRAGHATVLPDEGGNGGTTRVEFPFAHEQC
jgi:hypothetical protein